MKDVATRAVCIPIPKDAVHHFWGKVEGILDKAVRTARGKFKIEDVKAGLDSGVYLLWVVMIDDEIVAAVVTRITKYPRCNAMSLDWIGGKRMKEWIGVVNETMVAHAKHNGCNHLEGFGRPAWLRWIRRQGWQESYTAFTMEFGDV